MAGNITGKVFLGVGVLVAVFAVVMIVGSMILLRAHFGDKAEEIPADAGAGKALVVYQPSLSEASGDVAHGIARGLADGGYTVTLNHPGGHLSADVSAYDVIVLGGPVYAGRLPGALPEYAAGAGDLSGKTVILYSTLGSTSEGPEAMPEFSPLYDLLGETEPYAAVQFRFNDSDANQDKAYRLGLDAAGQ